MRKRKKIIKRRALLLIVIVVLAIFTLFWLNKPNNLQNKTIEILKKNDAYNKEYDKEYQDIKYLDIDDFSSKVNKYLSIGYTGKEINNLFKLSKKNQDKLLELEKKDITKFVNIKNFNIDNLERYNEYLKNNKYDLIDIVTYVNINLDKDFYTETKEVQDPDSLLVLVNKYNHLPSNYKPKDIVYVPGAYGNEVPFRAVLKDDFIKLQEAAKSDININLMPTTAFRNESFQTTLYNNYVSKDGKEAADTYSARPGYSEHQTGLAIDLKNMALSNTRLTDDNFEWLNNNAYKYGFIIRFPKDKEFVTGYQFENWHIRYVGKDIAKVIHDNNLTLEEYLDLYVIEY